MNSSLLNANSLITMLMSRKVNFFPIEMFLRKYFYPLATFSTTNECVSSGQESQKSGLGMSTQIEVGTQKALGLKPFEHQPLAQARLDSARQNEALMNALAAADNMAMFSMLQSEWTNTLAAYPEFSERVEAADPHVCDLDTLAELIALAPSCAIRQVLRETAYCREQMAIALDIDRAPGNDWTQLVLTGANAEWEIILGAHPEFSAWLNVSDRFTCSRSTLIDGMLFAPTTSIRHVLRETFCFREIAAMITEHEYK